MLPPRRVIVSFNARAGARRRRANQNAAPPTASGATTIGTYRQRKPPMRSAASSGYMSRPYSASSGVTPGPVTTSMTSTVSGGGSPSVGSAPSGEPPIISLSEGMPFKFDSLRMPNGSVVSVLSMPLMPLMPAELIRDPLLYSIAIRERSMSRRRAPACPSALCACAGHGKTTGSFLHITAEPRTFHAVLWQAASQWHHAVNDMTASSGEVPLSPARRRGCWSR